MTEKIVLFGFWSLAHGMSQDRELVSRFPSLSRVRHAMFDVVFRYPDQNDIFGRRDLLLCSLLHQTGPGWKGTKMYSHVDVYSQYIQNKLQ